MNRRRRNIFLLAFATALVATGLWAVWLTTPRAQFSASAWRNTPEHEREAMAEDFIANHFRPGMTRSELIALLGNPDPGFPQKQELHSVVGLVWIDLRVLQVRLGEDGKAVSATIYQTS